jgi:hypothetical protein
MPSTPTPAQQAASRANGARSRGPATASGKAAAARNGTRHGLRSGPFALLPGEDADGFAGLHAAVTADWGPRDAYERRWVMELVTSMWRQERLRGLELATLAAAEGERPPTEATLKRLVTFARYGARIDKDIAKALQALRSLRNRPDAWILDAARDGTSEPEAGLAGTEPRFPAKPAVAQGDRAVASSRRTSEPEPPAEPAAAAAAETPPTLNRHQRRRLEALERQARRWAA